MNPLRSKTLLLGLSASLPLVSADVVDAGGCNCRGNVSPSMMPVPMTMPAPYAAPRFAPPPVAPRYRMPQRPMGFSAFEATAPPGTLGRTYKLCSRPLPEDEHPRNAGLEVKLSSPVSEIYVDKMEDGYTDADGLWHFITEKPLLPHNPAIVKVVMTREHEGEMVKDVRVVRLIPGRILSVEF